MDPGPPSIQEQHLLCAVRLCALLCRSATEESGVCVYIVAYSTGRGCSLVQIGFKKTAEMSLDDEDVSAGAQACASVFVVVCFL